MREIVTSGPGQPERTEVIMSREELRKLDQKVLEARADVVNATARGDRLANALREIVTSCDRFHEGAGLRGIGTHASRVRDIAVDALEQVAESEVSDA